MPCRNPCRLYTHYSHKLHWSLSVVWSARTGTGFAFSTNKSERLKCNWPRAHGPCVWSGPKWWTFEHYAGLWWLFITRLNSQPNSWERWPHQQDGGRLQLGGWHQKVHGVVVPRSCLLCWHCCSCCQCRGLAGINSTPQLSLSLSLLESCHSNLGV